MLRLFKMGSMRFSILTITYNAEKFLEKTLESVACQKFQDYEHLIFDGGSKDRTLEIAKKFSHVKIFQGKDEGISDAMNQIAALAKGEFLLHLHADDLLADDKTLLVVDTTLRQYPSFKWLYGLCAFIDETGVQKKVQQARPFCHKKLKKYNTISHPATYYSRELFFKAGGFKKELKLCMDYDLWRRFALDSQPLFIPKIVAKFREHTGSTSTSLPFKVADEAYLVRNSYATNIYEKWRSYRIWKRRTKKI